MCWYYDINLYGYHRIVVVSGVLYGTAQYISNMNIQHVGVRSWFWLKTISVILHGFTDLLSFFLVFLSLHFLFMNLFIYVSNCVCIYCKCFKQ